MRIPGPINPNARTWRARATTAAPAGCRSSLSVAVIAAIPDTLRERIALFRDNAMAYQEGEELFRVDSWVQVMIGQGVVPRHHHRMAAIMGEARLRQVLDDMRAQVARQVATLPAHQAFLERYCPYPR